MVPIHVKDLEGSSVAVDTYSWLHKGALPCGKELCKSQPTSKHVNYCMHPVNLLRRYGVKPILVFDGGHLPMKNEQEIKRARGSTKDAVQNVIGKQTVRISWGKTLANRWSQKNVPGMKIFMHYLDQDFDLKRVILNPKLKKKSKK